MSMNKLFQNSQAIPSGILAARKPVSLRNDAMFQRLSVRITKLGIAEVISAVLLAKSLMSRNLQA
jgi:hypothetical protein